MEKVNPSEQKNLIIELTQGRDMANELKKQLDSLTSPENCEALVEKILSAYDKALAMLTWRALKEEELPGTGIVGSPQSQSPVPMGSPQSQSPVPASSLSEGSNGTFSKAASGKRKTLPKWSEQIRVCSGTGLEGPLEDGHTWRKYGQKDILGSKFPRAYYRCTHRHSRGCLATKQVQRSDEDPSIFEVSHKGRHTCIQTANSGLAIKSDGDQEMPKPKKARSPGKEEQGLKVETEVLKTKKEIFRSFSFSFTGVDSENLDSLFFPDIIMENDMMGSYSPAFLSPTTSDQSNYFSSSCERSNSVGVYNVLHTSEYGHTDLISTPSSVITNSPFDDLDLSIPSFTLDDPVAYFS